MSEDDIDRVHHPLMSPLVWDLGHIAAFEDLWLCQRAGGLEPLRAELSEVYDAAETPRARRGDVPYLRHAEALDYMDAVRERALGVLERADLSDDGDRLNANGFVWEMLVQHEHQHNETMLQTLQLAGPGVYAARARVAAARGRRKRSRETVLVPGRAVRAWATPAAGSPTTTSGPVTRRPPGLRDRPHAGDQRRLPRVRRRRRLPRARAVERRGLGAGATASAVERPAATGPPTGASAASSAIDARSTPRCR